MAKYLISFFVVKFVIVAALPQKFSHAENIYFPQNLSNKPNTSNPNSQICNNTNYRFDKNHKKCYQIGTSCGLNMKFFSLNKVYGICDCDYNTHVDFPLIYHPQTKSCYFAYSQGYCQNGQWLIYNKERSPVCARNTCLLIGQSRLRRRRQLNFNEPKKYLNFNSNNRKRESENFSESFEEETSPRPQTQQQPLGLNGIPKIVLFQKTFCVEINKKNPLCRNDRQMIFFEKDGIFPICGVPDVNNRQVAGPGRARCVEGSVRYIDGSCRKPTSDFDI